MCFCFYTGNLYFQIFYNKYVLIQKKKKLRQKSTVLVPVKFLPFLPEKGEVENALRFPFKDHG